MLGIVRRKRSVNTLSAWGGYILFSLNRANVIHFSYTFIRTSLLTILERRVLSGFFVHIAPLLFTERKKKKYIIKRRLNRRWRQNIHDSPVVLFVFFDPRLMEPKTDLRVALNDSKLRPVGVWAVEDELVIRPLRAP